VHAAWLRRDHPRRLLHDLRAGRRQPARALGLPVIRPVRAFWTLRALRTLRVHAEHALPGEGILGPGTVRSSRGRLGAGLVDIPPVPYRDPASAILVDPQVAETKRFCSNCDQPVGRAGLRDRGGARARLPARPGPVYCDFKPDNVIQTEEQLKLIDMGGVRRIDSDEAIYGTVGYQAPEIEADGPSPSSDLYTVGRALAVLIFDFRGYQGAYKYTLPDGVPILAEQESFARLLRRATNRDPDRRFGSASEMSEQLTGVLREVLAVADGVPRPAFSTLFAAQGAFSAGYDELPGELAPKLALAFAAEAAGDPASAGRYFRLVWTVDKSYISAAFGLARARLAAGDRPGAIAALAGVPPSSSHHAEAQIAAVRILVSGDGRGGVNGDDLHQADGRLTQLVLDDVRRQQLTLEVLRAALSWCTSGQPVAGGRILGCEPNARAVRFGLERTYRALARLTPDEARRIELVDLANAIRPRTLT
jgi:hypothetical protein